MTDMKDVMLDLETLGTKHDAAIIQIGACYFNRETGEIGDTLKRTIRHEALGFEYSTDYDTIKWWFMQSDAARASVFENAVPLMDALIELSLFLKKPDVLIWSHATFDAPILMNAFEKTGIKFPIPFRNLRDLRTLNDISLFFRKEFVVKERTGIHHDALDDAKYQAEYASEAFRKIYGIN